MRYFLPAALILFVLAGCGSAKKESEKPGVTENDSAKREAPEVKVHNGNAISEEELPEKLTNAVVTYRNNLGHELRLEIMGQNHDHIWYYSSGEGEMQIIPMMGENDIYAMTTNEGERIGNMQFKDIETETGVDLPGKIEVDVEKAKSVFKRVSIND